MARLLERRGCRHPGADWASSSAQTGRRSSPPRSPDRHRYLCWDEIRGGSYEDRQTSPRRSAAPRCGGGCRRPGGGWRCSTCRTRWSSRQRGDGERVGVPRPPLRDRVLARRAGRGAERAPRPPFRHRGVARLRPVRALRLRPPRRPLSQRRRGGRCVVRVDPHRPGAQARGVAGAARPRRLGLLPHRDWRGALRRAPALAPSRPLAPRVRRCAGRPPRRRPGGAGLRAARRSPRRAPRRGSRPRTPPMC